MKHFTIDDIESLMGKLVCWFKRDHEWVYSYTTYVSQSFRDYWENWEERICERCKKSQERKLWDTRDALANRLAGEQK